MKLLRDFFRLRAPRRLSLAGRRQAVRPRFTVTVPQPLEKAADRATVLSRPHEHPVVDAACTSRHLHLLSSH